MLHITPIVQLRCTAPHMSARMQCKGPTPGHQLHLCAVQGILNCSAGCGCQLMAAEQVAACSVLSCQAARLHVLGLRLVRFRHAVCVC